MRILIIADPGIPVPPKGYGGIERVIFGLACAYKKMGHTVTLMASSESSVEGVKTIFHSKSGFPAKSTTVILTLIKVWIHLLFNAKQYDVIQNFGRLANFFPIWYSNQMKFMCYQRQISRRNIEWANKLHPSQFQWIACSRHLINGFSNAEWWSIIHNPFSSNSNDSELFSGRNESLIFLGRLEQVKGCHHAIEVAKAINLPLVIAGNISKDNRERTYFNTMILPNIDEGAIQYVGEVDETQKREVLSKAGVLLFPIEWDEPFGIVMVEAMSYGTPVISFNRGSAKEVIDEGVTGFVVDSIDEMKKMVPLALSLNRALCRQRAFQRFSIEKIASEYLQLMKR